MSSFWVEKSGLVKLIWISNWCSYCFIVQAGDFYEAIGINACILVEYAGLNPFDGLCPESIPKAGYPVMDTHAHPGSPYVFGLVGINHDLDFPEPMPVVGISRSARAITLILETMKTYSLEDGLTEDALVSKLHTWRYHHLFLHTSLRRNISGTCCWGEFGEGGLLSGDVVPDAIPTEGVPCLLKVLLPSNCAGLPVLYVRDLLLNPPAYEIASTIQAICKLMSNVTCSILEFTWVSSAKLT